MTVQAVFQGRPLAGAVVAVRNAHDLGIVIGGLTTGADGRVGVPIPPDIKLDTVVLVTASEGTSVLSGLFLVPGPADATVGPRTWSLDLATTLVARRLTSKVAEVVRSAPVSVPSPSSRPLPALIDHLQSLASTVRKDLDTPQRDQRVGRALAALAGGPEVSRIEDLATALIRYSGLRPAFTEAVDRCNRAVVDGISRGGPLVLPALWQMVDVVVPPPQLVLVDDTRLRVTYDGKETLVAVAAGYLRLAMAESVATPTNHAFAAVNTTHVPLLLTGGGGGGVGGAPLPPVLRKIAFVSDRTGNSEIFVMNADGSNPVNLTNDPGTDTQPEWSPDGTKIAFVSNRSGFSEIYVMDADGGNVTSLTNTGDGANRTPTWSPDGSKIAIHSTRNGVTDGEIYVINADGTGEINVSNDPLAENHSYIWSPDSTRLVFTSNRDNAYHWLHNELYVVNANGTGLTRITNQLGVDYAGSWSPDGSRIAILSNRSGNFRIYTIKPDGTDLLLLTNDGHHSWVGSWSPDGATIAYRTNRDGNDEIYMMNADGTNKTNLTNDAGADDLGFRQAWSHDGQQILFTSTRDGNQEIYVMNADGSLQTNLTNDTGADSGPRFQP